MLILCATAGAVIDENWLKLTFPRFYEYDILRGLALVVAWAAERGQRLSKDVLQETAALIESKEITSDDGRRGLPVERQFFRDCQTRIKNLAGEWVKQPSSTFPLLLWSSQIGQISPTLTHQWYNTKKMLADLSDHAKS